MGTKFPIWDQRGFQEPRFASELLWTQAEVCISRQLEEQWQKQDGSGPAAFNCDSAAICACVSMHVTIQSSGFVCVVLKAARPVWNNRTRTHTHTEEVKIPAFLGHGCPAVPHTHTEAGQRKSLVTTSITVRFISFVLNTLEAWMCTQKETL